MDQNAFRTLLASNAGSSSSGGASKNGPAPLGRAAGVLGTHAPKRGQPYKEYVKTKDFAPKKEDKPTAFAPRKVKKDPLTGKYKDRAEMRRLGLEDEFKPVEQLLEDFERRAKEGGEDEAVIEEQRKFLGGDAQHSILVKGLDYGLLAARKAEIESKEGQKYDEELDNLLETAAPENKQEGPSRHQDLSLDKGAKKRKSRDEVMAELKAKRVKEQRQEQLSNEEERLGSRFRKITATPATAAAADLTKKKKKKKKVPKAEASHLERVSPASETASKADVRNELRQNDREESRQGQLTEAQKHPIQSTSDTPKDDRDSDSLNLAAKPKVVQSPAGPSTPSEAQKVLPPETKSSFENDEEDDIFGGVGEYSLHISDDSDEDDEKPSPRAAHRNQSPSSNETVKRPAKTGRGWFGDVEPEDEIPVPAKEAQQAPSSLSGKAASRPEMAEPSPDGSRSASPAGDGGDFHRPLPRLQPLASSSLPSVKDLLAMDKQAEALAKKKAKKAKWRAQQGLPTQEREDDDDYDEDERRSFRTRDNFTAGLEKQKANRDAQQLEAFMSKKTDKSE